MAGGQKGNNLWAQRRDQGTLVEAKLAEIDGFAAIERDQQVNRRIPYFTQLATEKDHSADFGSPNLRLSHRLTEAMDTKPDVIPVLVLSRRASRYG
jgi:hypothetical protein